LPVTGQTQSRERNHAGVSAFAVAVRSRVITTTYSRRSGVDAPSLDACRTGACGGY
jgi:hypothetical protein